MSANKAPRDVPEFRRGQELTARDLNRIVDMIVRRMSGSGGINVRAAHNDIMISMGVQGPAGRGKLKLFEVQSIDEDFLVCRLIDVQGNVGSADVHVMKPWALRYYSWDQSEVGTAPDGFTYVYDNTTDRQARTRSGGDQVDMYQELYPQYYVGSHIIAAEMSVVQETSPGSGDWTRYVDINDGQRDWMPDVVEGLLDGALAAPSSIAVAPETATLSVYSRAAGASTMSDTGTNITVSNRDPDFTRESGQYLACQRYAGEWRPMATTSEGGGGRTSVRVLTTSYSVPMGGDLFVLCFPSRAGGDITITFGSGNDAQEVVLKNGGTGGGDVLATARDEDGVNEAATIVPGKQRRAMYIPQNFLHTDDGWWWVDEA